MTSGSRHALITFVGIPTDSRSSTKNKILFEKEIERHLLAPSIVLTEFIDVAGERIGEDTARTRISLLKERGMRTAVLDEDKALIAGGLLLSNRKVPIAEALIASFVKVGVAEYLVTDDSHFKALGVKTKWL